MLVEREQVESRLQSRTWKFRNYQFINENIVCGLNFLASITRVVIIQNMHASHCVATIVVINITFGLNVIMAGLKFSAEKGFTYRLEAV